MPYPLAGIMTVLFTKTSNGGLKFLIKVIKLYVKSIDSMTIIIGNIIKFLVLLMIAILAYEAVSRNFFNISNKWSLEMTQFVNGTYYLLGGAYAFLLGGHVRMDFFYDKWSRKRKAIVDICAFILSLTFLVGLLIGGFTSSMYALKYNQTNYSAWGPPIAPMKIIATIGIALMLLQNISELIKDVVIAFGKDSSWIKDWSIGNEF
jgi:TRAP-type mannitol/chloroaromatic compound transport system permease small subunit